MEPLKDKLVVQELSKEFGANEVLHRISFSVKDGEFLSILGPSGCGKTTIGKIITGILKPSICLSLVSVSEPFILGIISSNKIIS